MFGGSGKFARQSACVVGFDGERQQWVCQMLHPRFSGKQVLARDELLTFEGYAAADVAADVPAHLRVAVHPSGDTLVAVARLEAGSAVLEEQPFMATRRTKQGESSSLILGVYAWKTYARPLARGRLDRRQGGPPAGCHRRHQVRFGGGDRQGGDRPDQGLRGARRARAAARGRGAA